MRIGIILSSSGYPMIISEVFCRFSLAFYLGLNSWFYSFFKKIVNTQVDYIFKYSTFFLLLRCQVTKAHKFLATSYDKIIFSNSHMKLIIIMWREDAQVVNICSLNFLCNSIDSYIIPMNICTSPDRGCIQSPPPSHNGISNTPLQLGTWGCCVSTPATLSMHYCFLS